MSTLILPDELYEGLIQTARQHGKSIEELLAQWLEAEANEENH